MEESSSVLKRLERELPEIKAEMKSARAERWVDTLTAELTAERARLVEAQKKLATSARLKELEARNRENALKRQLAQSNDQLKTKTGQAMRLKEQVNKLQSSMDQAKTGSASDENSFKFKLSQAQKSLQASRAEKDKMEVQIEDLQKKLDSAQELNRRSVSAAKYDEATAKLEKANREIAELQSQGSQDDVIEEQRKNLAISQQVAVKQKERSEQLEREMLQLKLEVERLQQALVQARALPLSGDIKKPAA
jgi:hypothetical protein